MNGVALMRELLAIGLSKKQLAAVLTVIDGLQAHEEPRLKAQRERARKYRQNKTKPNEINDASRERHVTVTSPSRDGSSPLFPPSSPDKEKVSIPLKEINPSSPLYPPSSVKHNLLEIEFEQLWRLYPRKTAKAIAFKSFRKARTKTTLEVIHDGLLAYLRHKPEYQDWCHFSTWLNQERWNDQYSNTNVVPIAKPLTPYQQNQADRKKVLDELAKFAYGPDPADQDERKNGGPLGSPDHPTFPFGRFSGA